VSESFSVSDAVDDVKPESPVFITESEAVRSLSVVSLGSNASSEEGRKSPASPQQDVGLPRMEVDEENSLFKVSGKQHVSFEVILVHNAMETFQQKVPPILLGVFEDIFD
jgi:hypothetical protein